MTARPGYTLVCDGEFCTVTFATSEVRVEPARAIGASAGWSVVHTLGNPHAVIPRDRYGRTRDFCPRCTADLASDGAA